MEKEPVPAMKYNNFCEQEVFVPQLLPSILREYSKAAIRTQPRDLLVWSCAYFRALADGDILPVKDRLEYSAPEGSSRSGLTPGLLRILHKQLNQKKHLTISEMKLRWVSLCLPVAEVDKILQSVKVDNGECINWITFLALATRSISHNLGHTMEIICRVVTNQPEGCTPYIDYSLFAEIYKFLAEAESHSIEFKHVEAVLTYLKSCADTNFGLVGPPDFDESTCPLLY